MERVNRGIALEKITEVTKISPRHLVALEQEQFRQLPGGILNKGIVRGYVRVVGLDEESWVDRFMQAWRASGEVQGEEQEWVEFAKNVGRSRHHERDAAEARMKWLGVLLLFGVVVLAGFFIARYLGVKEGWWQTIIPGREVTNSIHDASRNGSGAATQDAN